MKQVQEIAAEQENFRCVELAPGIQASRRDPVEPVPVGSIVAMVFRVTGYDPDCDGSLMARLARVDRNGRNTGWNPRHIGICSDCDVLLDSPGELHELAKKRAPSFVRFLALAASRALETGGAKRAADCLEPICYVVDDLPEDQQQEGRALFRMHASLRISEMLDAEARARVEDDAAASLARLLEQP